MSISIWIESIKFSGGQVVALEEEAIVIVVGPNNAGKSSFLREVSSHVLEGRALGPVTTEVNVRQRGSVEEFDEWLQQFMEQRDEVGKDEPFFSGFGTTLSRSNACNAWERGNAARALGKNVAPSPTQ